MSESNSARVSLVERTSFDTAAPLNMHVLLGTGQSMRNQVGYAQSQTLRTDANVQDLVRLTVGGTGGLPIEMQWPVANEAIWYALRAMLRSVEAAEASTTSCTTVVGTKTITRAAGSFITDGYEAGDIVKNIGATPPGDNGFFKVTIVAALTLTVQATTNFAGSAGNVTVVRGARMKNGTERKFFDIEVGRLDTNLYELFRKFAFDGMTLNISDNAITTASFQLVGPGGTSTRDTSPLCLSYDDPTSGPILDALGVPVFNVGGLPFSAKSISITMSNNVRARTQVGTLGGTAMPFGTLTATTRITSYYSNFTEINNYTNNVATDMWFVMQNENSQALSFSYPRYKWSDLGADTRGLNQDDYLEGSGQIGRAHV